MTTMVISVDLQNPQSGKQHSEIHVSSLIHCAPHFRKVKNYTEFNKHGIPPQPPKKKNWHSEGDIIRQNESC